MPASPKPGGSSTTRSTDRVSGRRGNQSGETGVFVQFSSQRRSGRIRHHRTLAPAILRPDRNVWRIERAGRASVLVDGAALFRAVREAMVRARKSIFIVGWDIDSRTRLVGESGKAEDGLPDTLVAFLSALVERNPDLVVHLLLWDYSVLYSLEREFLPQMSLDWATPRQVRFCLDHALPVGSSQHQKIVVVDDAVAFSGGLDLTIRRWDTPKHELHNPARVDPAGTPYRPFHDVQIVVDGDAARALAELTRERWERASCENPDPVQSVGDPWPGSVVPDFVNADIGIARTQPRSDSQPHEVREVEALFLDSIDAAERTIYIENQFLTSQAIADRLAEKLRRTRKLEAVLVAPNTPHTWIEARTMRNGRIRFRKILEEAGVADRFRLVYPEVRAGDEQTDTMVHSKVMVVDDKLLRIGSANLNNRSMGTDTECDIAIEARNDADREAILRIRNGLLAEHCGADPSDVEELLEETGSLVTVTDILSRRGHALRAIDDGEPDPEEIATTIEEIADPLHPLEPQTVMKRLKSRLADVSRSRAFKFALVGVGLLALTIAWYLTPLAHYARPDFVRSRLAGFADSGLAPLVVPAIFVAGGMIAFPLTIMVAASAAAFGPVFGTAYSVIGALASALASYWLGAVLGRNALREVFGPRLTQIRDKVRRQGVIAVMAIRLVPIAPFTVVNVAMGASGIRLLDYLAGTLLGLAPGLIVMAALGNQIVRIVTEPTLLELALLAGLVAAWVAVSVGVQYLVARIPDGRH